MRQGASYVEFRLFYFVIFQNGYNTTDAQRLPETQMDCRIQFGNDGFIFQAALRSRCVTSVINPNPIAI